jgi:hypothetical protein
MASSLEDKNATLYELGQESKSKNFPAKGV